MDPPKTIGEIKYTDPDAVEAECRDFRAALDAKPGSFVEPFLTAPSPGIIVGAMKNEYYDSEESYLAAVADALQIEYEAIIRNGFLLQLDCPDLGLERHLTYNDRPLADFLGFVERVVAAINKAIVNVLRATACGSMSAGAITRRSARSRRAARRHPADPAQSQCRRLRAALRQPAASARIPRTGETQARRRPGDLRRGHRRPDQFRRAPRKSSPTGWSAWRRQSAIPNA